MRQETRWAALGSSKVEDFVSRQRRRPVGRGWAAWVAGLRVPPARTGMFHERAWILINKQSVAGSRRPSLLLNAGMARTVVFSVFMLYVAAIGFWEAA